MARLRRSCSPPANHRNRNGVTKHEFRTVGRQDRTRCAADAHDASSRTTSPTSTPPASRRTARCSRTCCTRTSSRSAARPRRTPWRPRGLSLGTGVRVVATEKNYTQGSMTNTGNSLDVAIKGRGFFQVLMPDGSFGYTRDGSFKMSAEGELVTSSGYHVQPGITIPAGAQSITIGTDGIVSAQLAGQSAPDADRHAAADRLRQSRRPAAARREPGGGVRRQRPGADQHAGPERPRHAAAGRRSRAPTSTWSRSWST